MSETNVPAAEAEGVAEEAQDEQSAYELAFHILPTVAEEEVSAVFESLKEAATKAGGTITNEEAPDKFALAYEVVKRIDGKNQKFESAYFGWIRFSAPSAAIAAVTESVETNGQILRHLLIRLTKIEEENPFRFHEALADQKMVSTVEESEVVPDFTTVSKEEPKPEAAKEEETGEVDEKELEKALEEKEV